jgi:hypothetical protein
MLRVRGTVQPLGKSKVNQFNVSVAIDDDILRLQVSVYYFILVHDLESKQDLSRIESNPVLLLLAA